MRKWILPILTFFLLIFFFFNFYYFLKKRVTTSEFKSQTERKLSQILNAKVKVGKIRFGLLKHVSLSGLQIGKSSTDIPLQLDVQRVTIKYNLMDFLGQNFKVPAEVLIDAPAITLESIISPFDALGLFGIRSSSGSGLLKKVELNEGQFQINLPNIKEPFSIKHIKGRMWIDDTQTIHLNFKGALSGIANGGVTIWGELNQNQKEARLECMLEDASLNTSSVAVTHINGKVLLSNDKVHFDNLTLNVRTLPVELSGEIAQAFQPFPKWYFAIKLPKIKKSSLALDVQGDTETRSISGSVHSLGRILKFEGLLQFFQDAFAFQNLNFDNGYLAQAEFGYESGVYSLRANKGVERFNFDLNLKDFKTRFHININHWKIGGHDITTSANINLEPIDSKWELGDYRFKGDLQTNYFILNYHPLRDFKAEYEISELGLNPVSAQWGGTSHLTGSMSFGPNPSVDFQMQMADVALNEFQAIGSHPLPLSMEGTLEGRLRMMGFMASPEVSGRLVVRQGKISDFKYDEAIVEFYGAMPHLKLLDSKIVKKDNTFLIQGEIDFALKNILQKVKIVSLEQVIIWKGLDVESEVEGRSVASPSPSPVNDLLKPLNASTTPDRQKIEAEYEIGGNRSIQVTAEKEKNGEEGLVTVGPKIRF